MDSATSIAHSVAFILLCTLISIIPIALSGSKLLRLSFPPVSCLVVHFQAILFYAVCDASGIAS